MEIITYSKKYREQVIPLIENIYIHYGYSLVFDGFDKDLLAIEEIYIGENGNFWIMLDKDRQLKGCVAVKINNKETSSAELKRFYISQDLWGKGYAEKLFMVAYEFCLEHDIEKIYLWSDVKFTRSHNFYAKKGFEKLKTRYVHDDKVPFSEYLFELTLNK